MLRFRSFIGAKNAHNPPDHRCDSDNDNEDSHERFSHGDPAQAITRRKIAESERCQRDDTHIQRIAYGFAVCRQAEEKRTGQNGENGENGDSHNYPNGRGWIDHMVKECHMKSTMRIPGRPKRTTI